MKLQGENDSKCSINVTLQLEWGHKLPTHSCWSHTQIKMLQSFIDLRTSTSTECNLEVFFCVFSTSFQPGKLHCTIFHLKNE